MIPLSARRSRGKIAAAGAVLASPAFAAALRPKVREGQEETRKEQGKNPSRV
jgi:hypothetical protein